jgi:hypothetical protein
VEVGGVRACRSIILAEPGAAGFAGIAAFSSLLLKEAGFGVSKRGPRPRRLAGLFFFIAAPGAAGEEPSDGWQPTLTTPTR